ncbi:hypothetical protein WDU94_008485 [Cyamophila willieti]
MASLNMSPSQMIDDVAGTTHSSLIFSELGDDIKKIFSMPLDENRLYSDNHELCTKTIELNALAPKDPPKKKRGRPRKDAQAAESSQSNQEKIQETVQPIEPIAKRKRKVPSRYLESVQGTELEKILNDTDTEADTAKFLGPNASTTTTVTVLNTADTFILGDDLEPFHIAASDHMLDATNPLVAEIPLSTTGQTVPISNDLVAPSNTVSPQPAAAAVIPIIPGQVVKSKVKSKEVGVKVRRKKKRKLYLFCEVCNKSFPHNLQLKMHRHTHNLLYKCSQCSLHYHIYSNLEGHQANSLHTNYEIVDQNVQDPLVTEDSHVIDSYINEENGQITCRHCNKQFLTKTSLTIHIKLVLNKSRAYSCPMCQEFFQMYASLRQHIMNKHKSKTQIKASCVCDICNKVFAHPSSVLYHKATTHNTTAYKCPKCPKEFRHTQLLNRHQLVHMETRPFKCCHCKMSFKTNISLNAHLMKHTGAKAHVCEICNKVLTHRSSLISHYRWHQGIKLHQCSQCPKAFNQKGNLKEHFRIHTGEKPFSCEICGRRFTTYSQHKLHMKRHTGEKPHTCELCLKGFLSAESYKCHLRRHRGEKPYLCMFENCNQTFVESWALKKHQRVHMDQPVMLSCHLCDKSYSCTTTLKKHLKTHDVSDAPQSNNKVHVVNNEDDNKVSLLNIDLSLLDIINKSAEQSEESKEVGSPHTEILSRSEAITSFSEPDGNVFYLYEDSSGLIATTGEGPDKSPDMEEQTDEATAAALLQNDSFELVTDGSKFHIVRFPVGLTTDNEEQDDPDQEPGENTADSIITISNEQAEMIDSASMPPLILTQDMIDDSKLDTGEAEDMDGQEEEEQNFIEFITEDGNHVRMMGVSYNSLQLLTMDSDIQMFETKT